MFDTQYFLDLIIGFFLSWQVKTLFGLILIDLGLGVAAALRAGRFDFGKLAGFYGSNIVPYVLGYLVFYVAVGFIIPAESLGAIGEPVSEISVTLAWATLVASLLHSIVGNFNLLYKAE